MAKKQDNSNLPFSNTRVHPMESDGNSNGQLWAKHSNGNSSPNVQADPLTYESVGSCDHVHSSVDMATPPQSQSPKSDGMTVEGEVDVRGDVNLDFSHANDVNSSPSVKPMITNGNAELLLQQHSAPYRRLEHPADKSLMLSFIISLLSLIAALLLFCPSVALIVLLLPLGLLIKRCAACCCCCAANRTCTCCCSKMLSHTDTFWLHDCVLNKMVNQCLFTLEEGLDLQRIQDLIMSRLVYGEDKRGRKLYPRFTQKVVPLYSGYSWVTDPDFSVANHIFIPSETVRTDEELQNYVSKMASQPLLQDKPLWEMHVMLGVGEAHDTVILCRLHPSISDGISLVRILFRSVADNQSMLGLKPRFGGGAFLFNVIRALFIGPLVFFHKWLFTRADRNMLHGPQLSGSKVVAWSEPYSMAKAWRIKQVTRSSLNDVFLTVASGSLRTYLQQQGIGHPYDMLTSIPVDLSSDSSRIKLGNRYVLVDLALPTNTEGIIPRLWEIKHRMDELKNSADAIIMQGAHWILLNMLPECLCQRIWRVISNKGTCTVVNLPGPDTGLLFGSREVKTMMYWTPAREDVGLSISFLTYADQVRMTVISDKAVMPDPELLTKDFTHQMDCLTSLLANRRTPGEHPRRHIEAAYHEDGLHQEPSIEEIQMKISEVQIELQDLKTRLDQESGEEYSAQEQRLTNRVEELKEEFRELLAELKRKKAVEGSGILSDDEEDEDGEIRRPYRKRTMSGTSRRSIVSTISSARPLTTSPPASQHSSSPPLPRSSISTSHPAPLLQNEEQTAAGARSSPSGECSSRRKKSHDPVGPESADDKFSPAVERKTSTTLVTLSQT